MKHIMVVLERKLHKTKKNNWLWKRTRDKSIITLLPFDFTEIVSEFIAERVTEIEHGCKKINYSSLYMNSKKFSLYELKKKQTLPLVYIFETQHYGFSVGAIEVHIHIFYEKTQSRRCLSRYLIPKNPKSLWEMSEAWIAFVENHRAQP